MVYFLIPKIDLILSCFIFYKHGKQRKCFWIKNKLMPVHIKNRKLFSSIYDSIGFHFYKGRDVPARIVVFPELTACYQLKPALSCKYPL